MIAGPLCRLPVLNANPLPMEFAAGDGQVGGYGFGPRIRTDPLGRSVGKPPTESRRHAIGHKKG